MRHAAALATGLGFAILAILSIVSTSVLALRTDDLEEATSTLAAIDSRLGTRSGESTLDAFDRVMAQAIESAEALRQSWLRCRAQSDREAQMAQKEEGRINLLLVESEIRAAAASQQWGVCLGDRYLLARRLATREADCGCVADPRPECWKPKTAAEVFAAMGWEE